LESLKVLRAETASQEASLEARAAEIEALRAERYSLSVRLAEQDESLQARAAEITSLRTDLAGLNAALGAVQKDINRVSKERDLGFKKRDGRIAELNEALKTGKGQVQALEGEIQRIMNSRSIRITAPLRRLWALFGRGGA
jgi:chromosome segregation ATPase